MTRLYYIETIFNIIIIGLEAQPPPKIILLLHSHSDSDSNNNNTCCYYYIIILAESLVQITHSQVSIVVYHLKMLQPLFQFKSGAIPVNNYFSSLHFTVSTM